MIFNNVFTCVQEIVLTKHLRAKRDQEEAEKTAKIEAEKAAKREANREAQRRQALEAKEANKKKGDK